MRNRNGRTGVGSDAVPRAAAAAMKPLVEPLEGRAYMSITVGLRVTGGGQSATVTKVGQVIALQAYATISGSTAGSNDGFFDLAGSFEGVKTASTSLIGNLQAQLIPDFTADGASDGKVQDLNGDGGLDVGSTDTSTTDNYFFARSGNVDYDGLVSGDTNTFVLASFTYTVTSLGNGTATDLNFVPAGQIESTYSAFWIQDGTGVTASSASSTYKVGAPVVVTGPTTTPTPTPTGTLVQRTGTVIGTGGSYQNDGNTVAKAVDGNVNTFYDGATANGNYVGLDLGTAQSVSEVKYAPRSGLAGRMVGGIFQGSNSSTFASGVANLYTVTSTPATGSLTTATFSPVTYRYYRYLSPSGSYGNIAEFQLFGTSSATKRTGTVISNTTASYQNDGDTAAKAEDGSTSTFFNAPTANGNWVGLDLGSAQSVSVIEYAPGNGLPARMVGGVFQASNSATFSTGVVNLYTVSSAPASGTLTAVSLSSPVTYRYYRYLSPNGSYGNIAEAEFFG